MICDQCGIHFERIGDFNYPFAQGANYSPAATMLATATLHIEGASFCDACSEGHLFKLFVAHYNQLIQRQHANTPTKILN